MRHERGYRRADHEGVAHQLLVERDSPHSVMLTLQRRSRFERQASIITFPTKTALVVAVLERHRLRMREGCMLHWTSMSPHPSTA